MPMQLIEKPISLNELKIIAQERYGDLVKAVVDVVREIMVIGGELHADEEVLLLEYGSRQEDLWGINIYPEKPRQEWIEYDSVVNLRPSQGNRSREVENQELRTKIANIVTKLIQ